jgi:hypothetical protein
MQAGDTASEKNKLSPEETRKLAQRLAREALARLNGPATGTVGTTKPATPPVIPTNRPRPPTVPLHTPGSAGGSGIRLGEGDDPAATPGPGMPNLARARQIKAAIDQACLEAISKMKSADPQSPFAPEVDAILSETARLIQQDPNQLRAPNYERQKRARLAVLSECATTHGEIRQHAQQVKTAAKLSSDSPEATRLQNLCTQAGADIRATPDQRASVKERAIASMDKVPALAAIRLAIETALGESSTKITKVSSRSPFLRELESIRRELGGLVEQGSEQLSTDFQAAKIATIGQLPDCATAYGEVEVRAKQSRDGIQSIWVDSPQLDEIDDLCEAAVDQMSAEPGNREEIKTRIVVSFDALDKQAKEGLFADCLETATKKFPGPKYPNRKVEDMLAFLTGDQAKAGSKSFKGIAGEFGLYVWPALRQSSGSAAAGPRLGTSGLPTRRRSDAAGLETGFALRKAIREASGAKNGARRLGMRKLFSPGGLSTERGGRTGFYHWHCPGTAQDNMIYSTDHVVYGFTDSHIDSDHAQGQQQAKNVERRDNDSIEIGIDAGGNIFQLVDG